MTPLVVLTPGVAGHLAIAGRRYIAALEASPNLSVAAQGEIGNLRALIAQLDEMAKSGQLGRLLGAASDNESNLLEITVGAAAAVVSASPRTIRRWRADGILQGRRGKIDVRSLRKLMVDGRPTRRAG